ncbi:MAG: hypothetical protein ACO1N9_01305 [Flavobacterium sp.]
MNEAISAGQDIHNSINQTFVYNGVVEDIDKVYGGGLTARYTRKKVDSSGSETKEKVAKVIISGNSAKGPKDVFGKSLNQDATDILLHELLGHAIP